MRSCKLGCVRRLRSNGRFFRAQIVLLAAAGVSTRAIARKLDTLPRTVSTWRIRFAETGLLGLDDKPRPGGRASAAKYDETTDRRILAQLDQPPPAGYARWTGGLLAAALGDVSDQYVWRLLRAQKIDLDGRKSWCVSHDPKFVASRPRLLVCISIRQPAPWCSRLTRSRISRRWNGRRATSNWPMGER